MRRYLLRLAFLPACILPVAGDAATLTVDAVADAIANDATCTLREAVIAANQDADFNGCIATGGPYGADEIVFDPGLAGQPHVLTLTGAGNASASTGDLDITDDLVITGDPAGTEIDGNQDDRVFDIGVSDLSVTFNRLVITGGSPPPTDFFEGAGGGIRMAFDGTLALNDCSVIQNGISNGTDTLRGGGIRSAGSVILNRSEVIDNSLSGTSGVIGGGISINVGELIASDSRISGNSVIQSGTSTTRGGGIAADNGSLVSLVRTEIANNQATTTDSTAMGGGLHAIGTDIVLVNSTLSGNTANTDSASNSRQAQSGGAFINLDGTATFTANNSTIYDNAATAMNGALVFAGGINVAGGDIFLANTLIAGNERNGSPSDCFNGNLYTSMGYNLVEDNCGITAATGDQFGVNPQLGPLGFNGGANMITGNPQTHIPMAGSPAIDAGNPANPGTFPACAPTDQRGFVRPGDTGLMRCDIGAHEFNSPFLVMIFMDGFEN